MEVCSEPLKSLSLLALFLFSLASSCTSETSGNSGKLVYRSLHTPCGALNSETTVLNNGPDYTFTGYEQENALSMLDANARMYQLTLCRMSSIDPVDQPGESSYSYAANNPVNLTDPDGRQARGKTNKKAELNLPRVIAASTPTTQLSADLRPATLKEFTVKIPVPTPYPVKWEIPVGKVFNNYVVYPIKKIVEPVVALRTLIGFEDESVVLVDVDGTRVTIEEVKQMGGISREELRAHIFLHVLSGFTLMAGEIAGLKAAATTVEGIPSGFMALVYNVLGGALDATGAYLTLLNGSLPIDNNSMLLNLLRIDEPTPPTKQPSVQESNERK